MNTVIDFNIDKERYFKSIERLEEIYRRVSLKATESSEHRCPTRTLSPSVLRPLSVGTSPPIWSVLGAMT